MYTFWDIINLKVQYSLQLWSTNFSLIPGLQAWDSGFRLSGIHSGGGMQFKGTNSIGTIFECIFLPWIYL